MIPWIILIVTFTGPVIGYQFDRKFLQTKFISYSIEAKLPIAKDFNVEVIREIN